jgi:hypothetical protein
MSKKITYSQLAPHRFAEVLRRMKAEYDAMRVAGKNPAPLYNPQQAWGIFNATCSNYLASLFNRETVDWADLSQHCRNKIINHFHHLYHGK